MKDVEIDVENKDYREHLIVREGHATITKSSEFSYYEFSDQTLRSVTVIGSSPRFGFFVFLVVASQIALLAGYILYRRRKDKQPKKYL